MSKLSSAETNTAKDVLFTLRPTDQRHNSALGEGGLVKIIELFFGAELELKLPGFYAKARGCLAVLGVIAGLIVLQVLAEYGLRPG